VGDLAVLKYNLPEAGGTKSIGHPLGHGFKPLISLPEITLD